MTYTLQVSNHVEAGSRLPSDDATKSWQTVYDGPIATAREARETVDKLATFYRHARAFRGKAVGKLYYAVLRTRSAPMVWNGQVIP